MPVRRLVRSCADVVGVVCGAESTYVDGTNDVARRTGEIALVTVTHLKGAKRTDKGGVNLLRVDDNSFVSENRV